MDLVSLLILVIVLGLVFALGVWIIQQLPIPQPFKQVALAILGLIILLVILGQTGLLGEGWSHRTLVR